MNQAKISIGLSDPKSPSNVGAVLRAAGCFQADAIYYTGSRYARAMSYQTDTHNAGEELILAGVDNLLNQVDEDMSLVCVELVEGATPLAEYQHPQRAFYVFGPEDGTLSQELVDRADAVVYIPSSGCLNLAATVNIVLYDRIAKSPGTLASDALIRRSRDRNNKVKLKRRPGAEPVGLA